MTGNTVFILYIEQNTFVECTRKLVWLENSEAVGIAIKKAETN